MAPGGADVKDVLPPGVNRFAVTNKHAWLYDRQADVLHWVPSARGSRRIWDQVLAGAEPMGTTGCRKRPALVVPDLFTRMSGPRCESCSRRAGIPEGLGTPSNWTAPRFSAPIRVH